MEALKFAKNMDSWNLFVDIYTAVVFQKYTSFHTTVSFNKCSFLYKGTRIVKSMLLVNSQIVSILDRKEDYS